MKSGYFFIALCSLAILLNSCAAITRQQKDSIKELAGAAKVYAAAPKTILTAYNDCLTKTDNLAAAVSSGDSQVVSELEISLQSQLDRTEYTVNLLQTFDLLSNYYQALLMLTDADTAGNVQSSIGTLGTNLDSLFSAGNSANIHTVHTGLGTIVGQAGKYVGKRIIQQKQLKLIKRYLDSGYLAVSTVASVLDKGVINTLIKPDLKQRNSISRVKYHVYLDSIKQADKTAAAYLKDVMPVYTDIKLTCGKAIQLINALEDANKKLPPAQKELLYILQKKQSKYKENDIASFVASVNELNSFILFYNKPDK